MYIHSVGVVTIGAVPFVGVPGSRDLVVEVVEVVAAIAVVVVVSIEGWEVVLEIEVLDDVEVVLVMVVLDVEEEA